MPAPTCDPATLVEEAKCLECAIPPGFQLSVLVYLFSQIAGVSADPKTLMNEARCIEACIPPGMLMPVLVALACQIVSGGVTPSGSIQIMQDTFADPNGNVVPAATGRAALYYPNGGGTLFQWDIPSQTWV